MSNANNRRNKLKHISKRTETLTKTERILEENDMNEVQDTKTAVTVDQNTVTAVVAEQIQTPLLWMLAAADIRESVPALANWSDKDLEPTIAAVAAELKRAGASIGDNTVSGIDIEEFNRICNSVLLVAHKREITDHLEKEVRVDVIDIIGSGLKDPELRTLVDNIVAKCYTQNVDPSDGEAYYEILDGFIDPVIDQIAQQQAVKEEAESSVHADPANPAIKDVGAITPVTEPTSTNIVIEEAQNVDDVDASKVIEHSEPASPPSFQRQPLVLNVPAERTTDVIKASKTGGQNVTLTAMVGGKEVEVESVRVHTAMQPYKPAFVNSNVDGSDIAFAAMDEFYEYRSPMEKKAVLLNILKAAAERFPDHRMDELYIPMNEVDLKNQLTDDEISIAIWGRRSGPFDSVFEIWNELISVEPRTKSMKLTRKGDGVGISAFGVMR